VRFLLPVGRDRETLSQYYFAGRVCYIKLFKNIGRARSLIPGPGLEILTQFADFQEPEIRSETCIECLTLSTRSKKKACKSVCQIVAGISATSSWMGCHTLSLVSGFHCLVQPGIGLWVSQQEGLLFQEDGKPNRPRSRSSAATGVLSHLLSMV